EAVDKGRNRLQVPFQPEWIMEALGMAEYDPAKSYQVVANKNTIELIEPTLLPQGQTGNKITIFTRSQNGLQVTGHVLKDSQQHQRCTATILTPHTDPHTRDPRTERAE